ncbi:hypothetical protein SASPL_128959 [Salvia splendens]|uniref:Peptidase C1A papain C-terminal domain-containing protein n=1 Tax=Salvia splendens TaxID=180675 RepID=A0A8X8XBX8_SALSN|nr:hypothetical protein SASPL_128959 [Salvia splendens]
MDIDQPDAHSHVGILPDKLPTSLAWHLHSNIMSPVVDQGDTRKKRGMIMRGREIRVFYLNILIRWGRSGSAVGSTAAPKLSSVICWALATLSGIEAWSHLKYGESSKLSVQELLNCKEPKMYGREDVDIHKFYTGSILDAFNWIESKGIQLQKDYEWEGVLGECKPKQMKWNGIDLDGHKTVSIDEESMLIALNKGPVVGAVLFDRSIDECGKCSSRIRSGRAISSTTPPVPTLCSDRRCSATLRWWSGALILGKASLSEWNRFRSLSGVPNGWCARSGQGVVCLVWGLLERFGVCLTDSCCLVAIVFHSFVNAIESVSVIWDSMWIEQWICNIMVCVSLGSETHSSIICPSVNSSVVGIKPTVGLTSRADDTPHPFMEKIHGTAESEAFELHIDTLRGAQIIDNLKIDQIETIPDPNQSGEISIIMAAEFKAHIHVYLKELDDSPVRSLADIIAFNENNPELVLYIAPTIIYERDGMPFGICFRGLKGSEAKLIEISYGFEQVTKVRKPPSLG